MQDIAFLVISQENSCRYCYGAARAFLRIKGYSESLITHLERQAQLAELDERERAFVHFCRNLARSKPRPGSKAREDLIALGFAPEAVVEIAFLIASHCFGNRITTLMACPPDLGFERISTNWLARPLWPLMRIVMRRPAVPAADPGLPEGSGDAVAETLRGLPAAGLLHRSIADAFASPVIPLATKALMFAVIARSLECRHCEQEMRGILQSTGLEPAEVERSLNSLTAPKGDPNAQALIEWARGTVHYQPQEIQRQTRELLAQVGPEQTLEAVGIAALANATVRLAMLLE
jgi:alkylhydroperoxidase family enzyme